MTRVRTAYELSESQVTTPEPVVSLFWRLTKQYRSHLTSVLVVVLPRSRRDRRRGPRTWQILAGCIALIAVLTALARLLR